MLVYRGGLAAMAKAVPFSVELGFRHDNVIIRLDLEPRVQDCVLYCRVGS